MFNTITGPTGVESPFNRTSKRLTAQAQNKPVESPFASTTRKRKASKDETDDEFALILPSKTADAGEKGLENVGEERPKVTKTYSRKKNKPPGLATNAIYPCYFVTVEQVLWDNLSPPKSVNDPIMYLR